MTTAISAAQETRLSEIATALKMVVGVGAAAFGGPAGQEAQLQSLADDLQSVFAGSAVTFSNDQPQADEAVINRYLSATALGREVLKAKGITPNDGTVRTIDVLRARGDAEPSRERLDKLLAASPAGRQVLADRAKKGRS
jgi:ribosomal protein L34